MWVGVCFVFWSEVGGSGSVCLFASPRGCLVTVVVMLFGNGFWCAKGVEGGHASSMSVKVSISHPTSVLS